MMNFGNNGYGFPQYNATSYQNMGNYLGQSLIQPNINQYSFVNGIEGAKSFQVQPGKTVLLVDNDNPVIYFKSANELGQSVMKYFSISEIDETKLRQIIAGPPAQQLDTSQYVLKDDFKELLDKYDNLSKQIEKLQKTAKKEA